MPLEDVNALNDTRALSGPFVFLILKCTNRKAFDSLYQPMQMKEKQGIVSSNIQKDTPDICKFVLESVSNGIR
jgi:hypothetical protein